MIATFHMKETIQVEIEKSWSEECSKYYSYDCHVPMIGTIQVEKERSWHEECLTPGDSRLTIALVSSSMLLLPCPATARKYKLISPENRILIFRSNTSWTYWFAVASDFWTCCGVGLAKMYQLIWWSVVCYIMPAG